MICKILIRNICTLFFSSNKWNIVQRYILQFHNVDLLRADENKIKMSGYLGYLLGHVGDKSIRVAKI